MFDLVYSLRAGYTFLLRMRSCKYLGPLVFDPVLNVALKSDAWDMLKVLVVPGVGQYPINDQSSQAHIRSHTGLVVVLVPINPRTHE
jgi:hypothetical protein